MTMPMDSPPHGGLYKSAVLLVSLGTELAARVLSQMDDQHVELLITEMMHLGRVPGEDRSRIIEEFGGRLEESADGGTGGPDYARQVLEQAVGPERARQLMGDTAPDGPDALTLAGILENTSPKSLAALVTDEHPQLIALLIGQLTVDQAAALLAALPGDVQGPVAARLAEMEAPAPIALEHLERCLIEKLRGDRNVGQEDASAGPRRVADILGRMRRSMENLVLASLEQQSSALAQRVNQYRFSFENLLELDARSLQRILRDVEADTLRLAMKGIAEEQQEIIFSNMSERAAARLREDLENSTPAQLREVEGAQQAMVAIARALQESGEVQFRIGEAEESEEEVLV